MGQAFKKRQKEHRKSKGLTANVSKPERKEPVYESRVQTTTCPDFNAYYSAQKLMSPPEFDHFLDILKTELPISFRFTKGRNEKELRDYMFGLGAGGNLDGFVEGESSSVSFASEADLVKSATLPDIVATTTGADENKAESKLRSRLQEVSWYPGQLAWTLDVNRADMRKGRSNRPIATPNDGSSLQNVGHVLVSQDIKTDDVMDASKAPIEAQQIRKFKDFLVSETEIGNISRQEIVSMIPPLLLDLKRGQYVLDMCAAPGSKTAQLLEGILSNEGLEDTKEMFPDGLVIANDSDHKRAYMLVHQGKRLQTPCLMVTNHPAQDFPRLWIDDEISTPEGAAAVTSESPSVSEAANINASGHYLQFDRVLCDVPCCGDGTLRKNKTIFKTWTANQGNGLHRLQLAILERGCELVKIGGRLVYSTCTFNPIENEAVVAALILKSNGALRLVDVSNELKGLKRKNGIKDWIVKKNGTFYETFVDGEGLFETMFPPKTDVGLEKCLRVYPHLQNTGGFFVAVLEKVSGFGNLDFGKKPRLKNKSSPAEVIKEGWTGSTELPFLFLKEDQLLQACKDYHIKSSFPKDLFLVRTEDEEFKNVYIVSRKAKEVLTSRSANTLKLVNTGVKLFTRTKSTGLRVSNEGIHTVQPYLEEEGVNMTAADLAIMIKTEYPKFRHFSPEGQKILSSLPVSCHLITFDPTLEKDYSGSIKSIVCCPVFRANVSVSLLLDRAERASLLLRLTGETFAGYDGLDD